MAKQKLKPAMKYEIYFKLKVSGIKSGVKQLLKYIVLGYLCKFIELTCLDRKKQSL